MEMAQGIDRGVVRVWKEYIWKLEVATLTTGLLWSAPSVENVLDCSVVLTKRK